MPLAVAALGGAALAFGADALEDADNVQKTMKANQCDPNASYVTPKCLNQGLAKLETQVAVNLQSQTAAQQDLARGDSGTNYRIESDQRTVAQPIYQVKYLQPKPQIVKTETSGKSWGGAQTTTSEQYEEHTITNGEAFSSEESWGTATAVDSSHAADLWFTYRVRNTGAEYAREIGDLAFNIYIGDDPNPAITYFVAPELGGDGKFHNFMPNEEHTYTSRRIPLSLEQLKAIEVDPACAILRSIGQVPPYDPNDESTHCPGSKVRIVVEDFTYGIDELFYEDAVNSGVLVAIEDGTDDGDEETDTHLIPTWGEETVLDVLARYFPHTTDAYGNLIAIWTPEIRADTPSWCVEPRVVGTGGQRTLWCKHALSTADWWNVYTDGLGDGSEGFQDTPASPGSVALFRFNKDSDLDGYSDRSERRLGTDPNDPADHPQPELIAGVHSIRNGDLVVSTLSLLNTGLYDAYGVEAVMIAPDDSISITNNTVGGSGRVRAQRQVIVGSRILLQSPLPDPWTQPGHAVPAVGGYYTGQEDRTYTFSVTCSNPSGCDVGSGTWSLGWNDGAGATGSLNFGAGYASPTFLDVGAFGVQLALYSGKVYQGESFTVEARTPRDTFQYTINEEPHTEPVVIVSYNDPQGNHRFITPVALGHPADDLVPHSGGMLEDFGAEIVTTAEFVEGANTTNVVVNLPVDTTIVDAHLFLEFITTADISIPEDPDAGIVVHEVPMTVTLPAGPSVVSIAWDSDDFNPTYDPDVDYIVMAFWTDHQGNILDTAARPLSSFQGDPKPTFATDETTLTRDFGDVPRGEVLNHRIPLANIGFTDLLAHVSDSEHVSEATQWVGFTNANWVREIAKEGNYLWAATSGGAVAHDLTNGSYVKFTTVDDGLVDNDVLSVSIDGAGRKWFGTSSGISVLDDNGSSFDKADDAWIS
ncbi:MAG: hypothetical protein H8E35_07905, partial [Ardenticatenia bacterium]|nr:hypothetical protein [Ardenticatenia bacterium]